MNLCTISHLNAKRRSCRGITVNDFPFLVNQELGEVPLDAVTKQSTLARLQEFVNRWGIVAVHIHLKLEECKSPALVNEPMEDAFAANMTS